MTSSADIVAIDGVGLQIEWTRQDSNRGGGIKSLERDYSCVIAENAKFYEEAFRRLSVDSEISPSLVSFV